MEFINVHPVGLSATHNGRTGKIVDGGCATYADFVWIDTANQERFDLAEQEVQHVAGDPARVVMHNWVEGEADPGMETWLTHMHVGDRFREGCMAYGADGDPVECTEHDDLFVEQAWANAECTKTDFGYPCELICRNHLLDIIERIARGEFDEPGQGQRIAGIRGLG